VGSNPTPGMNAMEREDDNERGGLEPRTPKDPGQPLDPDVTEPGEQPSDPDIPQEPAPSE
jgi:hypothetical protein